ncbi:hypothetical protein AB3U99_01090 [Niallia sp. JL1B1071]|uniref:hypothetical protein n=1 Tax=Niallia tiangongensis TaxID=3237105 RepID=UPI0037DDC427
MWNLEPQGFDESDREGRTFWQGNIVERRKRRGKIKSAYNSRKYREPFIRVIIDIKDGDYPIEMLERIKRVTELKYRMNQLETEDKIAECWENNFKRKDC